MGAVVQVLVSAILLVLAVAKLLPFVADDLMLPRWIYPLLGLGEAVLAMVLWTRWTRAAAIAVVALGATGCALALAGFAHTCGCAGALRLSLVQHYVLAAVVAGLGSCLLGCDRSRAPRRRQAAVPPITRTGG